jgi:hypothetical protein
VDSKFNCQSRQSFIFEGEVGVDAEVDGLVGRDEARAPGVPLLIWVERIALRQMFPDWAP